MAGCINISAADGVPERFRKSIRESFLRTARTAFTSWAGNDCFVVSNDLLDNETEGMSAEIVDLPGQGNKVGMIHGHIPGEQNSAVERSKYVEQILASQDGVDVSPFMAVDGSWVGFTWDREARRGRFYRDDVGTTNLFVASREGVVIFATDIRVLIRCLARAELDLQAISEFLHYLYVPAPLSIALGIAAVLPGHVLEVDRTGIEQKEVSTGRFHVPDESRHPPKATVELDDLVKEFEERLLWATERCLPETGPIGLALSGGKDSTALAIALSKICPERIIAFTVGEKREDLDESPDAAIVCKHFGFRHDIYVPDEAQLLEGVDDFVAVQGQPVGDPAALPYFLAMKEIAARCDVFLDGTGNDYYFGIASEHRGKWLYGRRRIVERALPRFVWRLTLSLMKAAGGGMSRLAAEWSKPIEDVFVAWNGWSTEELETVFGRSISISDTYMAKLIRATKFSDRMTVETNAICRVWEPHAPYRKATDFANALGIQVRYPFASKALADFVQSLPIKYRNSGGVNKVLLREFMKRHLPDSILDKPKSGFVFDLSRLLKSDSLDLLGDAEDLANTLQLSQRGKKELLTVVSSYLKDGRDEYEQRVYAIWLLARVIAHNFRAIDDRVSGFDT